MDIQKILQECRLEVTHKFEVPPKCIEILNDIECESRVFGTFGNFSTILAPPKVGKTTLVAVPVAAYLTKSRIAGFEVTVPAAKEKVLWIDTEQGKGEAVGTIKAICQFAQLSTDIHPQNLEYRVLRKYSHTTRLAVIEQLINTIPELGLVVIDGIRDLLNSINDEREATMIATNLLKWSEEKNVHIITILHQNKGDGNARGHIGTELLNKAETVVNLSKIMQDNERQTKVESKYNRHKEFKDFSIVLRNNMPMMIGASDYVPSNPKADQLTTDQKVNLLNAVYSKVSFHSYSKLWQEVKQQLQLVCDISFGDNKCKELIKILIAENYIIHDESSKQYQKNV